jgi:hypothetical protein
MYSPQQIGLIAAPPVLLASTYFVFKIAKNRIGPIRGYLVGFLFYWIFWGFLFPWFLLGSSGLAYIFRDVHEKFGNPAWLGILLLLLPLVLGYAYAFPRAIKHATFSLFCFANSHKRVIPGH